LPILLNLKYGTVVHHILWTNHRQSLLRTYVTWYKVDTQKWCDEFDVPSGKHTINCGKSTSLIGKSTVSGPSSIAMLNYQNVTCVALFSVAVSKKNVLWLLIAFSSSVPQIMVVAWPLLAGLNPMCRRNAPAAGWLNDQLTYVYLVKTSLSGETVFFCQILKFQWLPSCKKSNSFYVCLW